MQAKAATRSRPGSFSICEKTTTLISTQAQHLTRQKRLTRNIKYYYFRVITVTARNRLWFGKSEKILKLSFRIMQSVSRHENKINQSENFSTLIKCHYYRKQMCCKNQNWEAAILSKDNISIELKTIFNSKIPCLFNRLTRKKLVEIFSLQRLTLCSTSSVYQL